MKRIKILSVTFGLLLGLMLLSSVVKSQVFYVGITTGANYSWFDSPKLENIISSSGYGWNAGFFLRYGKRPFFMAGFDWTRANNEFKFNIIDTSIVDNVPFHNFDFSFKVGYEIVQKPYFKWSVFGGPFIGRSLLFNSNEFEFKNSDFKNPQWGVIAGTGFQVTNFILSLEYSYYFSELFKPVDVDGYSFKFGSKLQIISLKVGMQF